MNNQIEKRTIAAGFEQVKAVFEEDFNLVRVNVLMPPLVQAGHLVSLTPDTQLGFAYVMNKYGFYD